MDPKDHWEKIYGSKSAGEVSWFQPKARRSHVTPRGATQRFVYCLCRY